MAVLERTVHKTSWVFGSCELSTGCCNQCARKFRASFRCTLLYLWISLFFPVNVFWTETLNSPLDLRESPATQNLQQGELFGSFSKRYFSREFQDRLQPYKWHIQSMKYIFANISESIWNMRAQISLHFPLRCALAHVNQNWRSDSAEVGNKYSNPNQNNNNKPPQLTNQKGALEMFKLPKP